MFIHTDLGHWNLALVTHFRKAPDGTYTLLFPVDGGKVKISRSHPQYAQIDRYLVSTTLGDDPAA